MRVRHVLFASVCSALLVAAAAPSNAADSSEVSIAAKAYEALAKGDAKGATAAYSEAIDKGDMAPDALANALLNRGLAYQQVNEHQKAVEDYGAALRSDALTAKLRATALYNRGLSYQKLKQAALAIDDFTGALFIDSEFSYAYYARGNALRDAGQFLFALSDFEKARRYGYPSTHFAFYGEALTLEQLKRPDEAKAALERALAIKPDFNAARSKLAALGGVPPTPVAPAPQAINTVTGSLIAGAPDQVVRKPEQPDAVAPPAKLLVSAPAQKAAPVKTAVIDSEPVKKRYTDRILPEDETPAPRPKIVVAAEPVESAPAPTVDDTATASISEADPATDDTADEPKGWSVQLASEREAKSAWTRWQKLKPRHALFGKKKPVVIKADLGGKGVYYRLRLVGYDSQNAAKSACSKLKAKGVSCYVSRAG